MDYKTAEFEIKEIILKDKNVFEKVVTYLYENFEKYSWVGIYFVEGKNLILGPWKGPNATEHTKIPIGQGICGLAVVKGKTEVISDVNADSRYLSCFVSTKSEIVIPIKKNGKIIAEIDIDSDQKHAFNQKDIELLEKIADMLNKHI